MAKYDGQALPTVTQQRPERQQIRVHTEQKGEADERPEREEDEEVLNTQEDSRSSDENPRGTESGPTNTTATLPDQMDLFCNQALVGVRSAAVNGHVNFSKGRISWICKIGKERVQLKLKGQHIKCVKINPQSPSMIMILLSEEGMKKLESVWTDVDRAKYVIFLLGSMKLHEVEHVSKLINQMCRKRVTRYLSDEETLKMRTDILTMMAEVIEGENIPDE
ncbi:Hypothetical predicted protein [Paramuricea clavata]|uniref:Uncharacterized protein n=1 Tax=Paramuricea clavata TaxID=317549 RepID=A0A7D9DVM7_PARCT|nr:Hypothetical predicted protein [Paramuricea clavata]